MRSSYMPINTITLLRRNVGWRLNLLFIAFAVALTDLVVASVEWIVLGSLRTGTLLVATVSGLIVASVVVGVAGSVRGRIARLHRTELEANFAGAKTHFGVAVETAQMLFWELDLRTGALGFEHDKLTWLGLAPDTAVETMTDWVALVHPQDSPAFLQHFQAALQPGAPAFDLDYRLQRAPGQWAWVHSRGSVKERNAQGEAMVAVGGTISIMERKLAEDKLRKSETLLRATLAATDEGILMIGKDGLVLSANQRFLELWRVPPTLAETGRDDLLLAHVLEQLCEPEAFMRLVTHLYDSDAEARDTLRFKDGRVFSRFTRAIDIEGQRSRIWCFKDTTEQTHFQTALAGSEQKLRSILDGVDACIYLKDVQGRYLFANRATCELWNRPLEEVVGRGDEHFFDEQTARRTRENDRAVFESGEKLRIEDINHIKGSEEDTIFLSIKLPLRGEDGSIYALCGISTDITAMKRLNTQLEESNQFLGVLMETMPIPIFYKDVQGRYLGFNIAYEDFLGRPRAELIGRSVFDIAPKELAEVYHAQDKQLMEQRGTQTYESQVVDGLGATREVIFTKACLVDASGAVRGLIGGVLDITQRKSSERALQESETKLRAIFEMANVGISIVDRGGHYRMLNSRWAQSLGFEIDEMRSLTYEQVTHPDDLASARASFDALVDGQTESYRIEKRYIRKDHSVMWADLSVAAIKGQDQQVEYILGMLVDITQRKLSEQALVESEQRTQALYTLLRMVADNVPDMIWAKSVDRRFLFANRAVCEQLLMANDTDEPLGKDDLYFAMRQRQAHPDDPDWHTFGELCQDSDAATLELGRPAKFEEFGNVNGKLLYLDVHKAPLIGENGEVIGVVGSARDITTERDTLEQLRVSSLVLANSSEALMLSDADNRIVDVNPAFTRITGYTLDEVLGRDPKLLHSGKQNAEFYQDMWAQIESTGQWQGEVWNRRKNGDLFAEWLTVNTLWHPDGRVHRRVGLFSDISDKKRSEELIWTQANFDQLTGLPNRRMFLDRLAQDIKRADRAGNRLALMFLDLDNFKEINDTLGHEAGDELLTEAARRIASCTRGSDTVARLGGDEFTVILAELTDASGIDRIAASILNALEQPFVMGVDQVQVSASIGITLYPDDAQSQEDLLRNADQAMYVSKDAGRNRFSYFTRVMQANAQHRLHMLADLRGALALHQFELHYQPIVELHSGRIHKAEALLRWVHPVRGSVGPAEFIRLAEDSGLIHEIGDWVFAQAAGQVERWRATLDATFQVSVNLSPMQIQSGAERFHWHQHLQATHLVGDAVVLEITEGLLLNTSPKVVTELLAYRDAGIQVAIDDFGTGYSAMSYLKQLDIDYLKIDKLFVNTLTTDASDRALCEAMVVMAHALGLKVIAEGVETAEQRDVLKAMGCDYAQGFLFAKALPAPEFEVLMRSALSVSR